MLKIKIVCNTDSGLPFYATPHSSGMDLRAKTTQNLALAPFERVLVPTGLRIEIPIGYEGQIRPRSGLALYKGITVLNAPGTIDADFRGELQVLLVNLSADTAVIEPNERIAQIVFSKHETAEWLPSEVLSDTVRGEGGFGHTGLK